MRFIGAGTRSGFNYRERRTFWTVPNLITVARFLLVPVFVGYLGESQYAAATAVLVILGCTDWVDGYIARRFDQVSTVGRWLDPLADRLALIIVAVSFVVYGLAPLWLLLCIVIPDAILLVYALVLFHGSPDLPVTNVGKVRTALLLIGTPLLLLERALGPEFWWVGMLAYVFLILGCAGHLLAWWGYMGAATRKYGQLHRGQLDGGRPHA
ncbi:CDP-alcohol phosphatidyltransferase family protein [Arthrobacter sp. I2-34]|uniref:CDP-alcohol phosphatidyltransferase family protein n=1 Tax=Arthrobacter hankyongi TaxID=2904801 RepID=A0ABS9L1B3_9MICC|nr:CDP-alcohol phosphatidyltransferase family protein [Arthrobacter hankyongi]MCG2620421.1 CDP-alcohol phosphatidyltransferase family protein [Arthrobacter hankyongi]